MNRHLHLKRLTDAIYTGLFGADGDTLRKQLGLPAEDTENDDALRDEMGIEALQALMVVERAAALYLEANPLADTDTALAMIAEMARIRGKSLRDVSLWKGVDPLTGRPRTQRAD